MNHADFPVWLRLTHFVNLLFITMLMRSGIQILAEKPKLYWNDNCIAGSEWLKLWRGNKSRNDGDGDMQVTLNSVVALPGGSPEQGLALGRDWHFMSVGFWILNGFVYVTLLFATGEWHRLVPTSWSIIPDAVKTFMTYASLHLPPAPTGDMYDPLQKLAYAFVVFGMAPMSILTGAAMSQAVSSKYPWYSRIFGGRQSARSIHFLLLVGYLLFLVAHVGCVAINDFPLCMNRITLGVQGHHREGMLIGLGAIGTIIAIHVAVTKWSLKSPARVDKTIGSMHRGWMMAAFGRALVKGDGSEDADSEDILRNRIFQMLTEEDLQTMLEPFPETDVEFEAIRVELRDLPDDDLKQKLIISGFAPHPINDQRCFECMYYLVNRKWCNIPELELPVEAEWWCRLWRI